MIYLFLADGFEEIEALTPYDLLLRAGADIKTVSINQTDIVTGAHGIKVHADICINDLDSTLPDAIILPGGMPGASNLDNNNRVDEYITLCNDNNKLICAICAAPFILGKRGLLNGKKAICFPGFDDKLTGAVISDKKVVTDANIITAKGMGVAFDFGIAIVSYLFGEEKAKELKASTMA